MCHLKTWNGLHSDYNKIFTSKTMCTLFHAEKKTLAINILTIILINESANQQRIISHESFECARTKTTTTTKTRFRKWFPACQYRGTSFLSMPTVNLLRWLNKTFNYISPSLACREAWWKHLTTNNILSCFHNRKLVNICWHCVILLHLVNQSFVVGINKNKNKNTKSDRVTALLRWGSDPVPKICTCI